VHRHEPTCKSNEVGVGKGKLRRGRSDKARQRPAWLKSSDASIAPVLDRFVTMVAAWLVTCAALCGSAVIESATRSPR